MNGRTIEQLELVLARAPVALLRVTADGVIALVEGQAARLFGRTAAELAGRPLAELAGAGWMMSALARALAGESFRQVGELGEVWLAIDWLPARDGSGAVIAALAFAHDITDEKKEEQRLARSEECYRRQSELAFEPLVIHDRGVIVDANQSLARLFGYDTPQELIGRHVLDLAAPESRTAVERALATDFQEVYEAVGVRKDGTKFAGQLRGRSLRWKDGCVRVVAIRDMAEIHRLRQEAEESGRRLRAVIDSAPLVLFALNREGIFILSEGRGLRNLGLEPGQVVGRSVFDVYRALPRLVADVRRALAGEEFTGDVEVGTDVWETTFAQLVDAEGQRMGILGVALDVSERKRAEADRERLLGEVDRERQRCSVVASELAAVLDCMVEAVLVCDVNGRFTRANRAARELFGIVPPEDVADVERWTSGELRDLDGRPLAAEDQPTRQAILGKRVRSIELLLHRLGVERRLRASAAPLADDKGQSLGAVAVWHDVTEEAELDRLKDEFLRVAAHELKTPVAVIKSAAQVALQNPEVDRALQRNLEWINRGADRIDRIVTDLLDMSQLQLGRLSLHAEPIDLGALCRQVVQKIAPAAPHHRIFVDVMDETRVSADPLRLTQIVTAVVRNAIKYSPAGGEVRVRVSAVDSESRVSVEDHGIGIPAARQSRIFERFYTAHSDTPHDYGGMGIGLYLAREFVMRHGGRLWFHSVENEGSTFTFALPRG